MDAYCDYIRQLTEARLERLRREAAEYRLAQSLKANASATGKTGRAWFGVGARRRPRAQGRATAGPVVKRVRARHPMPADGELRRSA